MTTSVPPTRLRRLTKPVRFGRRLLRLPPRVAWFYIRARFKAWRIADDAPQGALRPDDLAVLLALAEGRREVVELGISKAWTAMSLALAQDDRRVVTYDPAVQHVRERYVGLVSRSVRERVRFVDQPGERGPQSDPTVVDFLFIDSSHEREATVREYAAWQPVLAADAVVVFDDYGHPDFPGVEQAVQDLGLHGQRTGFLFIHRRDG